MVATSIGIAAAKKHVSTYFIKCNDLLQQLKKTQLENRLEARLKHFGKYRLLIIDEYGNKELLQQVWINLLDNAIKFSSDYGMIQICIVRNFDGVIVRIQDEGMGMDEEIAKHIFDKFYQGDTSHTTKGNGLGLTIAARIVALHQGETTVVRTGMDGTCFQIFIPEKNREMNFDVEVIKILYEKRRTVCHY